LFQIFLFTPVPEYSGLLGFDWDFFMGVIFAWVNVAVIIFILSWLLYKPVRKFLGDRRDRIASDIETAEENLRVSEETRAQYNSKLANIGTERDEILADARKMAIEREAEIIAGANNEAGLIMERARRELQMERELAQSEIRNQIIQVSTMMAERFMGSHMDAAAKDKLLDQAIAELGDAEWRN